MTNPILFTSESVTCGHPDKICDQISDAILDEALRQDKNSRVAVETAVKTGMVMVFGEMNTTAWVDTEKVARKVIQDIGYTNSAFGFDFESCSVLSAIGQQSQEIHDGVDKKAGDIGAGDQGMMFGYACNETKYLMPLPITLAHDLTRALQQKREDGSLPWLRPDGKSQVTVEYGKDKKPKRVHTVVISAQHNPEISQEDIIHEIQKEIITPVLHEWIDEDTIFHINPSGSFVVGGPQGDAGLTGRKIIVDTYGGYCPHGGGAFSGKDATKVDRSAAYAARHIAKNVVANGMADKCQIQISYAIGVAEPISLLVETFGTEKKNHAVVTEYIQKNWDLRPAAIMERFGLTNPIFRQTATYGHFGNDVYPWELVG